MSGGEREPTAEVRRTRRWRGVVAVALAAGAVGVLAKRPDLLLVAAVGVVYAAYPRLWSPPEPSVSVDRTVSSDRPKHDEVVEVTVTVRNEGDRSLFDLRVVDGVPPMLRVVDGTPRHATSLRPGESATFRYAVRAKRGTHRFEPSTVLARDLAGAAETSATVYRETTVDCVADVPDVPLRPRTQLRVGQLVTDDGGSGIEFHRVRDYQPGDAMNRIDWRYFARSGDLTTVEFREQRSAAVMLCVDARPVAYRSGDDDEPHAVAYSVAAAEQFAAGLLESDNYVGLTAVGREDCWIPVGSGVDHRIRLGRALSNHSALSVRPPEEGAVPDADVDRQVTALRKRLGADTQVVLFSPLADERVVRAAVALDRADHPVTVVSPNVTSGETPGARLARLERENRVHQLRRSEVPVADWDVSEPLGAALEQVREQRRGVV